MFRAAEHVQDFLPMSRRDILKFEGCALAWQRALAEAGIALPDLSFAEVHDCFTIAELIEYEAMGLAPEGQGARAIADGTVAKDGKLPINPLGRPEIQRPSDRRHRRVDARHHLDAARRHAPATCRSRTPSSAASSTWAAPRSRITSAFWSGCAELQVSATGGASVAAGTNCAWTSSAK